MEEKDLMRRIQNGDESAFAEIVRLYKDRIVNFIYQIVGDYQRAVELSQETFMRVYFKANHYKPIAPLSSWIYTIASNLAKTDIKRNRKYAHVALDDVENRLSQSESFDQDRAHSEMARQLRQAVDSLPPRYRIPIILKDIEGFSQEEISQMLRKPLGTIKARISRGRQNLKRELERTSFKMKFCQE